MEIEEIPINEGEWLLKALKRFGYDMIPTNSILDKTLPGLGATYSEIHSERNSIIIEPNVPVILGKLDDNENLEAVYDKCTPHNIKKYLQMDIPYKKILCTPESFHKIRKAAKELSINIYKDYFCLFDECEKIIQDIDYRRGISQPVYDFFQFEQKAFVSATPLPMSHPKFEEKGFKRIKIIPTYDYKKNLELIVTNSYDKALRRKLESLKNSKCICIFFNSTDGTSKIISALVIKDYKVFCSKKSVEKLISKEFTNSFENLNLPLAKYNFFTSRFFSALDINLRKHKPDVIILSNLNEAIHTMIDPYTEAIQIIGRFRKGISTVTHITNLKSDLVIRSHEDIEKRIVKFEETYNSLKEEHNSETDLVRKQAIFEDIQGLNFQDLIDEQGNINPFSVDNLFDEERVKGYYKSAKSLYNAYLETNHFNITFNELTECVGEDDLIKLDKAKNSIERRKIIVDKLEKINSDFEEQIIDSVTVEFYENLLKKSCEGEYTISAYKKIGKEGIEKAGYNKKLIDKAIKEYDSKVLRFSPEVIKDIKSEFNLDIYIPKEDIKQRLQLLLKEHSINFKVTQDTIKDYYDSISEQNSKKPYSFKLRHSKF